MKTQEDRTRGKCGLKIQKFSVRTRKELKEVKMEKTVYNGLP